jgi:transposase InsO family protein
MTWKATSTLSLRKIFIEQALQEGVNISELCRTYEISRKTAYKWLARYRQEGEAGLSDRSRRPKLSPQQTSKALEAAILKVRQAHPTWGGYKIKAYLERKGHETVPAHSTINAILKREQKIDPQESRKHKPFQRFEMKASNQLWQMDFKGHFSLPTGGQCHPLTVLDDHSRFLLGLKACSNETAETVQQQLTPIFRQYGLPERMLMDNGAPWGDDRTPYTAFGAWLIRLGISPCSTTELPRRIGV